MIIENKLPRKVKVWKIYTELQYKSKHIYNDKQAMTRIYLIYLAVESTTNDSKNFQNMNT